MHLGLAGRQPRQDAAEPQRLLAQLRPHPVLAGGGRVALVEDEVDHLQHRGEPLRQLRARAAPRTARASRPACAWRARCAAPPSAPGTRKARAISSVVRPPSSRSVSATRASVASTGWQAMNISRSRSSPMSSSSAASRSGAAVSCRGLELAADLLVLALDAACARRSAVDGATLGGGHQPGARVVRHARSRATARARPPARPAPAPRPRPRRAPSAPGRRSAGPLDPPDRVDGAMGVASAVTADDHSIIVRRCNPGRRRVLRPLRPLLRHHHPRHAEMVGAACRSWARRTSSSAASAPGRHRPAPEHLVGLGLIGDRERQREALELGLPSAVAVRAPSLWFAELNALCITLSALPGGTLSGAAPPGLSLNRISISTSAPSVFV